MRMLVHVAATSPHTAVMLGLDPSIHCAEARQCQSKALSQPGPTMDLRVKPEDDSEGAASAFNA